MRNPFDSGGLFLWAVESVLEKCHMVLEPTDPLRMRAGCREGTMAGAAHQALGTSTVPVQIVEALALGGAQQGPVLELYPFQGACRFTGVVGQWLVE